MYVVEDEVWNMLVVNPSGTLKDLTNICTRMKIK